MILLVLAVLMPMLLAGAFLLGRHLQRRREEGSELSAVTRQHIELFQGGQVSPRALEAAKNRLRDLLDRGQIEAVEASLRPGLQFVVQVRALAEIGTEEAGQILERQLHRRLTSDVIEQSWYWIDLANGLRGLSRDQSLPALLRCAEQAGDSPLGHFFAAETVCFLGFAGYVQQADPALRQAALRVLHRALEGMRCGVQPQVFTEARLGEVIEALWDNRPETVEPLIVRVFAEALRLLGRAGHAEAAFSEERAEQEAFTWQMSRLASLEPVLTDYLSEAPAYLTRALVGAAPRDQRDILFALHDLRADAAEVLLPLLVVPGFPHAELGVHVLTWSKDPRVGPALRSWVDHRLNRRRRARATRRAVPPRRPSVPADLPYAAILRALRGHGSPETEEFLLLASCDGDPTYRAAALSSLGWWEPFQRGRVLARLQEARRDPSPEVRQMSRAALARLGERQALQWYRQQLGGEDSQRVHEAVQFVANEGLVLLWADLDRLADSENADIAYHAREALERLREELGVRPM
jgi:HEAT repeat protein